MPESSAVVVFATPFSTVEAPSIEDSPVAPLPATVDLDPRKVALGKRLYFDKRLSGDGKCTCNDCHDLDRGGANGEAFSNLPNRPPVGVNVPTVFNAAFNFRFAWSGRFKDIGEQIDVALALKTAMAGNWVASAKTLAADPSYAKEFAAIYPEGLTDLTVREAVSIYTLSLVTPNARFDRHLRGELQLTADEERGWELFREYGCVSCHQGVNIGGNMFQKLGIVRDYFADRGNIKKPDYGLFNATEREEDRFVFRVPSLRNVALTSPYFHDGSVTALEDAVVVMARYQLGRTLAPAEIHAITSFLRSLTGELNGEPLAAASASPSALP
jgi:cytochrome c peroxidase